MEGIIVTHAEEYIRELLNSHCSRNLDGCIHLRIPKASRRSKPFIKMCFVKLCDVIVWGGSPQRQNSNK